MIWWVLESGGERRGQGWYQVWVVDGNLYVLLLNDHFEPILYFTLNWAPKLKILTNIGKMVNVNLLKWSKCIMTVITINWPHNSSLELLFFGYCNKANVLFDIKCYITCTFDKKDFIKQLNSGRGYWVYCCKK